MFPKRRVVVAMSGGVDSSVAAALLQQQGYDVIGMTMRLWPEPDHEIAGVPDAESAARRVADRLGIPFYMVDAQKIFREQVVQSFLDGYAGGVTPNPCLVCNRSVKWGFLLQQARSMGAEYLATGHYARVRPAPLTSPHSRPRAGSVPGQGQERESVNERRVQLLRGADPQKEQSYVLSVLTQAQLEHALFPVGEYTKAQVRQMAQDFDLPVTQSTESQDLCFLAGVDYREFLRRYVPEVEKPGPILTRHGQILGEHHGLAYHTIGQRKGLGLAAPEPLYVLAKEASRNALIVGRMDELGEQELTASQVNWISGNPPPGPVRLQVKIRYRAADAWALVTPLEGARVHLRFEQSLRDITPGQGAVFYEGEVCLGGGIIE